MILALDLSLTATGYARSTFSTSLAVEKPEVGVLNPPKGKDRGYPRVQWILDQVHNLAEKADLVVIEGYAFGAKNQQGLISIHELGGVIRFTLWEAGKTIVEIPPTSLKLFACGKGNAKKDEMLAASIRQLDYQGANNNEADALWLLRMTQTHYAGTARNDAQRRALEKIAFPHVSHIENALRNVDAARRAQGGGRE